MKCKFCKHESYSHNLISGRCETKIAKEMVDLGNKMAFKARYCSCNAYVASLSL